MEKSCVIEGSIDIEISDISGKLGYDCNQPADFRAILTLKQLVSSRTSEIYEKLFGGFGEGFEKRVPAEGGALDAHRKLNDTLQCFNVTKIY